MLAPVELELNGSSQILSEGELPKFELDFDKTVDLLQGSNLYKSKFSAIREILQNSVDSSLLAMWIDNRDKFVESPLDPKFGEVSNKYNINVEIKKLDVAEKTSSWRVKIRDFGTGISLQDLKYMLKVGGSSKNHSKRKLIESMPEWLKPSGNFGIGLQSIFMISDSIKFKTKSIYSNEIIDATFYSPLGNKKGMVTIDKLPEDYSFRAGSEVIFEFECSKNLKSWSSVFSSSSHAERILGVFDPLLSPDVPYEAAKIADGNIRVF